MKIIKKILGVAAIILCVAVAQVRAAVTHVYTDQELQQLSGIPTNPVAPPAEAGAAPAAPVNQEMTITLSALAKQFVAGQAPQLSYVITNGSQQISGGKLSAYYLGSSMPNAIPEPQTIDLAPGQRLGGVIVADKISELYGPGSITFFIIVTDGQGRVIQKAQASAIVATKPFLNAVFSTGNKKVFQQGQSVPLNVAVPKGVRAKIYITVKNEAGQAVANLTKSGAWTAKTIGTYTIDVSAYDVNFKPYNQSWQIAVIAKPPAAGVLGKKINK